MHHPTTWHLQILLTSKDAGATGQFWLLRLSHLLSAIYQNQELDLSTADRTAWLLPCADPLLYAAVAELMATAFHCCWLLHAAHAYMALLLLLLVFRYRTELLCCFARLRWL
jgi:hypothetical protein